MNCSYAQNFKRYETSLGASQIFAHSSWFIKICTLLDASLAPSAMLFAREFVRHSIYWEKDWTKYDYEVASLAMKFTTKYVEILSFLFLLIS